MAFFSVSPPDPRYLTSVLCRALLLLAMIGSSEALGSELCKAECPCDREPAEIEHFDDSGPLDEMPEPDSCPDGCPDCHCCPGNAVWVLTSDIIVTLPTVEDTRHDQSQVQTATGAPANVFRPPR